MLFCGSRSWPAYLTDVIRDRINELPQSSIVMHGGARGADTAAGFWAEKRGLRVEVYKADWAKHGRAAGPIRNRRMLDEGPRCVVAFIVGRSRGTQDTIDEARRRGYDVEIHTLTEED